MSVQPALVQQRPPPLTHQRLLPSQQFYFTYVITPPIPALQAQRASLDITRAREDFDREQAASVSAWDASATERARALSLHADEMGRHTVEGRGRVAAAEASLVYNKTEST